MARVLLLTLLVVLGVVLPASGALADCEEGVSFLTAVMADVTDPYAREILSRDLKRAQLELWEFDEVECATALDHAQRFLRRQADEASSATAAQAPALK